LVLVAGVKPEQAFTASEDLVAVMSLRLEGVKKVQTQRAKLNAALLFGNPRALKQYRDDSP